MENKIKKISMGITIASLLSLTGCGESDTREKHIFTVEVEVTEPNGTTQKVKKDCVQMNSACTPTFKLRTPKGEKSFSVAVLNNPSTEIDYKEYMSKASQAKGRKEEQKITLSEYKQKVWVQTIGINLKDKKQIIATWKPRTERNELKEISIVDGPKLADLKIRIY